jgi:hypothetical protein
MDAEGLDGTDEAIIRPIRYAAGRCVLPARWTRIREENRELGDADEAACVMRTARSRGTGDPAASLKIRICPAYRQG